MRQCPAERDNPFSVAYVLTSNGRDVFADMALVSMLSVRISNPGLRIVAVCDEPSAQAIQVNRHRVLEVCDELISVPTPAGEPTFRNRWIKTQLCQFVSGNVLYLDSDTLVRGSLADLPQLVAEFGAVANHNGTTLAEQLWSEDEAVSVGMGWPVDFSVFVNGGFWFYKSGPRVHEFFQQWHELWRAGVAANGRLRDQPSLNSGILLSSLPLDELPTIYNTQVSKCSGKVSEALVWHFYASKSSGLTSFDRLVRICPNAELRKLERLVKRAIEMPAPWHNWDEIARLLANRVSTTGVPNSVELNWLNGRRLMALWSIISGSKRRLSRKLAALPK